MKNTNRKKRLIRVLVILLAIVLGLMAFYRFWFLRQPERQTPQDPAAFISPANGTVVAVVQWDSTLIVWEKDDGIVRVGTEEVADHGWLIAIEMNVMNVHYQRAPLDSRFIEQNYTSGKFNNAVVQVNEYGLRLENERNSLLFETESGMRYKVVQVAGLLARRIEDYVEPGQEVRAGEVIGLIKMGSQVALLLPPGVDIQVKTGDVVVDGETVVARF